ncbi:MAG: LCP family protein [Treponema sp.]|nr:LCP family protein [Treponema sp.]
MPTMNNIRFDASVVLLVAIIVFLGASVFVMVQTLRSDPLEGIIAGERVINTLFVLEDNEGKPLVTYVLMYYPATRRASIFDIPGELGFILQKVNRVDRIDTVYEPQKIVAFESEVARLLGVPMTYSLVLDITSLGNVVDLIEGVEILIPSRVEIYDGEPLILFPSGKTRLDGDKARLYVSYELPEEDGEIISFRRQRFFLGLLKRLGERHEFLKNPEVTRIYQSMLHTNMNLHVRERLFDEYAGINMDRVSIQSVGGTIREVSGQTLLLPYYDGSLIKDIVRQTQQGLTRPAEGATTDRVFTVEVLNGTDVNGLAAKTSELLRGFGYNVTEIKNSDQKRQDTIIIDRSGNENMARIFGSVIQCSNIEFEKTASDDPLGLELLVPTLEYRTDFTLILGSDFNGRYVISN